MIIGNIIIIYANHKEGKLRKNFNLEIDLIEKLLYFYISKLLLLNSYKNFY